jgi:hypothetical protein
MSDPIVAAVQADLGVRSALGQAKYRTTLARTDLGHAAWLQHAYEEALDMACYLKRAMYQLPDGAQEGGGHSLPAKTAPVCVPPSSDAGPIPAACAPVGDEPAGAAFSCDQCGAAHLSLFSFSCPACFEAGRP